MKAKLSLVTLLIVLMLGLGLLAGCNKARSDAQITGEVQSKIVSDPQLQGKQISAAASNGVVTLSGTVDNEAQKSAAVMAASQIEGVKTVLHDNLKVASTDAMAGMPPMDQGAMDQAQQTAPPAQTTTTTTRRSTAAAGTRGTRAPRDYSAPAPVTPAPAPTQSAAAAAPAPAPAPAAPSKVTVPDGTTLSVRLIDSVGSETSQVGDTFRATVDSPVVIDGQIAIPSGADVTGRVVDVKSAGRFKGQSTLVLELSQIAYNGRSYSIDTDKWSKSGTARGKSTAAKVGGGAALGAIIGGIAGGGKGAAVGAAVGAGAGTGVSAATKGQQISLPSETVVNFQLTTPIMVTPSAQRQRGGTRID